MDDAEAEFLRSQELQPFLWLDYIDDIFFVWVQFLNELNNFHFNLKFTYETSSCVVNFLDLNVSLRNGEIHTNIYIKPTDGQQELHCQSSHLLHIKISIPYSQKLSSICPSEKDFKTYVSQIKQWILARCYPEIVVNN